MTILDQIAKTARQTKYSAFAPKTVPEAFALRLATKVGDQDVARHYVELADEYPAARLLTAYRRAVTQSRNGNLARRFHAELEPLTLRDPLGYGNDKSHRLAAVRIDRRAVGVAVLDGDRLSYAQARHLSSSAGRAISSAVAFIERILEKFEVSSVVIESIPNGHQVQRKMLQNAITDVLTHEEIDPFEVAKNELFNAFAYPPVRSRKELRMIASNIWPILDEQTGGPWTHDAAMLGLYVQIETLFENH
ncbi:MAG TPA: hypothetical protein VNX18_05400 [Bryobacteraceae bacterium]|nr:hypothetical protein [Bryobacteraceae bacterium]